ncbi:MAG: hypothetical protein CM1200mP22_33190 [Dehalococcoidia bacterium]|nr:MAG: hypothetical protein CM1200mP22_33190 [Dehalococcoidia bacterium]
MVLESLEHALARGAYILAELAGFGSTSDAGHPVQPEETGASAQLLCTWPCQTRSFFGSSELYQRSWDFYPFKRYS